MPSAASGPRSPHTPNSAEPKKNFSYIIEVPIKNVHLDIPSVPDPPPPSYVFLKHILFVFPLFWRRPAPGPPAPRACLRESSEPLCLSWCCTSNVSKYLFDLVLWILLWQFFFHTQIIYSWNFIIWVLRHKVFHKNCLLCHIETTIVQFEEIKMFVKTTTLLVHRQWNE